MLNFEILRGERPRFCHSDGDTVNPCLQTNIPTVDETALPCGNVIISTDCITTGRAYNFFNIGLGDYLSAALTKINDKVRLINTKFNNTIALDSLQSYADDTAAGVGGVVAGKPYVDTLGYLRIKL